MEGCWLPVFLFASQERPPKSYLLFRESPKAFVMDQSIWNHPTVLSFLPVTRRRKCDRSAKKASMYSCSNERLPCIGSYSGSFSQCEGKRCFPTTALVHQRARFWTTGLILLFFHYISPHQLLLDLILFSSSSASEEDSKLHFTLSPLTVGIFSSVLNSCS